MLINLYIVLVISAFVFFGVSLTLGSKIGKVDEEGATTTKKGVVIMLLLTAMVLFIITSLASFNVETEYCGHCCYNETNYTPGQEPLPASIDMIIECQRTQHIYTSLAGVFAFMAMLSIIFFFYYALLKE